MNIRKAEIDDFQDLHDIYEKSGKQRRQFNVYPMMEWILQGSRIFLIAETAKGKKVGFIVVREKGDSSGIDILAVNKKSKVDDVKKELINEAMMKMRADRIEIYGAKSDPFTKFLKSNGFEKIEEIKDMYGSRKNGFKLAKIKEKKIKKSTRILQKKTELKPNILQENLKKLKEHAEYLDEFGGDLLDKS